MIVLTSSVGARPRRYWGAYGASKAALEEFGAQLCRRGSQPVFAAHCHCRPRPHTHRAMRAKAYPGEDPATLKLPSVVADQIAELLRSGFETGHRLVID